MLAPLAIGAHKCLLLHTPDLTAKAAQCKQYLSAKEVECYLWPFERGSEMNAPIASGIEQFTGRISPIS